MTLRDLSQRYVVEGRIEGIFLRPGRREPVVRVEEARAEPLRGLVGDHRAETARDSENGRRRELTLIQSEHLGAVASWCNIPSVDPALLRRNLLVSGLNLQSMRSPFPDIVLEWAIGEDVRIEVTGPCDPCSRMEEALGPGGYNAMRGHGGVTAKILAAGTIRVGDPVRLVTAS